jgi:hypothetical protein
LTEVKKHKTKDERHERHKRHERILLLNRTLSLSPIRIITPPSHRLHKTSLDHFGGKRKKRSRILGALIIVFRSKSAEDAKDSGTKQARRIRAQTTIPPSKPLTHSLRQTSPSLNHLLSLRVCVFEHLAKRIALILHHTIVSAIEASVMSSSVTTTLSQAHFKFHAISGITVRILIHIKYPMDSREITEATRMILSTVCARYANSAKVNDSRPSSNGLFVSFDSDHVDGIYAFRDTQKQIRVGRAKKITCQTPELQDPLPSSQSVRGSAATAVSTTKPTDTVNPSPTAVTAAPRIAIPSITFKDHSASSSAASDSTRVPTRTAPPDAHPQILPMTIQHDDKPYRRLFCIVCWDRGCGLCREWPLAVPDEDTEVFDHSWRHKLRFPGPNYLCMVCLNRYCELCAGTILPRHDRGDNL